VFSHSAVTHTFNAARVVLLDVVSMLAIIVAAMPWGWAADRFGSKPVLLLGGGRERRLLEQIERTGGPALIIAPDVEAAARWARHLARLGRVARRR